jgi:hypothetical protein
LIFEDDKFYIEPVSEKDHLIDMVYGQLAQSKRVRLLPL